MIFNFDIAIVTSFLIINLVVGIYYGRNVKTLRNYAIGNRNFSTAAITATIIATWIGAGFFSSTVSETYQNGLWHIVARIGDFLTLAVVGLIYAPRMGEFLGNHITVGEMIDSIYGKNVRIITAIASIALSVGYIAVQIKVISGLFSYFFHIPIIYAVLISSAIIIIYSSFGGILSVTFTDKIQFFTFGVFVPVFAFFLWSIFGSSEAMTETFTQNPLFDYKEVFNYHNANFYVSLMLFIYFTLPALDPATCQRILMAKNTTQIRQSFINASILCLVIGFMACFIGIIALSHNPNMDPNNLLTYVVDNYSFTGLKGFVLIAIMAMGMSTADSYINAASVMFSRDLCVPLKIMFIKNELLIARFFAVFIGIVAILFVLFSHNDLFDLLLLAGNFYTPIVTIPLTLAVFGFRSSSRSVLWGMGAGFITVIIWKAFIQTKITIDSIIPGTIANLVVLLFVHYFYKKQGGWVGIKDDQSLMLSRLERKRKRAQLIHSIKNFHILNFFKSNLPKTEVTYSVFALYVIVSTYSSLYIIKQDLTAQCKTLYNFIYHSVFILSMLFLTYPLWLNKWKNKSFTAILWQFGTFYILVCAGIVLLLISNFNQIQLMFFIFNLVVLCLILRWQSALAMILVGIFISINLPEILHLSSCCLPDYLRDMHFKVIYLLASLSIILIAFFKPKQQYQELTEDTNVFLSNKVNDQKKELIKLYELKNEFLRNIEHEARTPITGIASMGQVLDERYNKLTEKQRRDAIKDIAKSSERLISLVNNLIDVSKLESFNYSINKSKVNLTSLVHERLKICKKLYIEPKTEEDREFSLKIEDSVTALCDKYYIERTIDNMIINAIQYCKKGKITIKLKSGKNNMIEFSIKDEGIGVPKGELYDIFSAFTVSSKTRTPAGGRGVGLALCKKAIEAHHGKIWAESDGTKGAIFKFTLPASGNAILSGKGGY